MAAHGRVGGALVSDRLSLSPLERLILGAIVLLAIAFFSTCIMGFLP